MWVSVCFMWQMKELLFKFVVQAVWRRKKELYYAMSVVSIAGNLVFWVGPSVRQSSIVLRSAVLQAAWSTLPQVAELVLHRSVLYLLLNLIVVRIVIKSGMLGGARTTPPGMPAKVDDFCLPASSYYVVRSLPWPATFNSHGVYEMQAQAMPCLPAFTDTSMWLQQARGEDQNYATVDMCEKTPARRLQRPMIKKSWADDKKPKCAPAPSLFTIEPLDDLVQTTDIYTSKDDQAHIDNMALTHPLRKVASRRADLHCSNTQARARKTKNPPKKTVKPPQQKDEQAMQLVLAKQDGDGEAAAEHEDNRLSGQEFNERVDTFISKFKRSLTMQRQDSFNRLLGLMGGGGDIRLIK